MRHLMENVKNVTGTIFVEALAACSEFCCDECPYQHLDDMDYKLRCIHTLVADTYKLLKEN